jgi:aryl-alcohol dehydrogenase-like predicted oxidoreductase
MIETAAFGGARVSRIIKGAWQLHEAASYLDRGQAIADMCAYADAGITTFETADAYRGVDELIGVFLRERSGLRVHCRLTVPTEGEITRERIAASVEATRARLGVSRVDLVQLAMWSFDEARWRAAAEHAALDAHIARLGVMNVDAPAVDDLRAAGVPIAAAQAQFSLIDRRAERTLLPYCRAHGLAFFGYGVLSGGLISERWLGASDPGPTGDFHAEYRVMIEEFGGWALFQRLLRALVAIGARHQAGIGAIALRWSLDRPGVTSLLVGASSAARLLALRQLAAITLTEADHAEIDAVLADSSGPTGPVGALERDPSGPMARAINARKLAP